MHALVRLLIIDPDVREAPKRESTEPGRLAQAGSRRSSSLAPAIGGVAVLLQALGLGEVVDADLRVALAGGDVVVDNSERGVGHSLEGKLGSVSPRGVGAVVAALVDVVVRALEVEAMEDT